MFCYANLEEFLLMLALGYSYHHGDKWCIQLDLRVNYPFILLRSYNKCFCACKCLYCS